MHVLSICDGHLAHARFADARACLYLPSCNRIDLQTDISLLVALSAAPSLAVWQEIHIPMHRSILMQRKVLRPAPLKTPV